ncbi:MAG TPA: RsmE family RNA methyltransferase [Parafilimonas sp.]|nr:RsmE family RNA methyltransferase [Parafilimonas sp.]
MNLPYFYEENIQQPIHVLSEETGRHCIQVLRMKEGEQLQLTNGKGNLFTATIIKADKKNCEVKIEDKGYKLPDTGIIPRSTGNRQHVTGNISIAISLLKNPSRLEWFMEKATEIGIDEIIPLICDHTEKQNFRYDRMQNILVSAMLQSRQTWLPQLHQPKKFDDFIKESFDGLKLIAHCGDEEKCSVSALMNQYKNQNKLILIGPEGDFSNTEISNALEKKFTPVSLGATRLRTETAGIVAATLLCNSF